MAGSEETLPSRSENHDASLARLRLERDTVNDTIDILHRQSSLIDEMLALVGRAATSGENAAMQERLIPAGDEGKATKEPTMSAVAKCFAVTELLEKILLCLGPVQLFGVLRVNRMFRDTIEGSQMLRQQMLLEPDAPPHAWDYLKDFLSDKKMTRAAQPLQFQFIPTAGQKKRLVMVEVWMDFTDDKALGFEGSFWEEEISGTYLSWRHLSQVERDLVDAHHESWRRVRLDLPLRFREHTLGPPHINGSRCLGYKDVEGGMSLGKLIDATAHSIRAHCDPDEMEDPWVTLHTRMLREEHSC